MTQYGGSEYFKPNPGQKQIIPDPQYNPNNVSFISASTKLAKGVSVGKFLGGVGEKTNLNHVPAQADRLKIARNLYPQAEAMARINSSTGKFKHHRLIVIEGLYRKAANENLVSGGLNDLASKGQVVVYQLIDANGKPDHAMMFDLAVYWKDVLLYDKVILDYDRFNPDKSLECHVILQMPEIPENYSTKFKKELETLYNGNLQSTGELIEILA